MAQTAFVSVGKGQQLLSGLEPSLFMWILSSTEIGLGAVPLQPQFVLDLGSEVVRDATGGPTAPAPLPAQAPIITPRTRLLDHGGRYLFEIKGKVVECSSLREMMKKGLLEIEEHSPGMLAELTKLKPRTKRIVAEDARKLFEDQKLVRQFSDVLKAGWFYGTNNSASETRGWLLRACEIAKLQWGKDFDVSI